MNKYQEALNKLKELGLSIPANGQGEEFGFSQDFDFDHDGYELECSLMQELVDKETPMKPIHMGGRIYSCDRCAMAFEIPKIRFVGNQYCDVCGQKIDWTNE